MRNNIYEKVLQLIPDSDGKVDLRCCDVVRTKSGSIPRRWNSTYDSWVRRTSYSVTGSLSGCKKNFDVAGAMVYDLDQFKISGDHRGTPASPRRVFLRTVCSERLALFKSFAIIANNFEQAVVALGAVKELESLRELGIIVQADAAVDKLEENSDAFTKAVQQLSGVRSFSITSSSVEEQGDDALEALGLLDPDFQVEVVLVEQ